MEDVCDEKDVVRNVRDVDYVCDVDEVDVHDVGGVKDVGDVMRMKLKLDLAAVLWEKSFAGIYGKNDTSWEELRRINKNREELRRTDVAREKLGKPEKYWRGV